MMGLRRTWQLNNGGERGLTIFELLIVVVIIGTVAGIAYPLYLNATSVAYEARVRSDVENTVLSVQLALTQTPNAAALVPYLPGDTLQPASYIFHTSNNVIVPSGDSPVEVVVSPTDSIKITNPISNGLNPVNGTGVGSAAGFQVTGTSTHLPGWFYTFSSITRGYTSGTVDGSSGGSPTQTPTPTPTPTSTPVEVNLDQGSNLTQMSGVNFAVTYTSQTNKLSFCYSVAITTQSTQGIAWQYKINLNAAPFWGSDPTQFGSTYNYYQQSLTNGIWTISGTPGGWNQNVTASNPLSFGFCDNNVPTPPINTAWFTTTVTPSSGNSNYYACLDVKTTSTSQYPIPWATTVDLSQYFKSVSGKSVSFVNLTEVSNGGTTYSLSGATWNNYVSVSNPQIYSASICYNPNGSPW